MLLFFYLEKNAAGKVVYMFNKSQIEAISHEKGPAIVLAGPGSGKTTVITHRIRNLIEEYNVPPEKILVVTFTKAAAEHMQKQFLEIINPSFQEKVCNKNHLLMQEIFLTKTIRCNRKRIVPKTIRCHGKRILPQITR